MKGDTSYRSNIERSVKINGQTDTDKQRDRQTHKRIVNDGETDRETD